MSLITFFHKVVAVIKADAAKRPAILDTLEGDAGLIQHYAQVALPIIAEVDAVAPNRTLEELLALGQKFALHVTPEIAADPIQVDTVLQNAALKELQRLAPTVSSSLLRTALSLAFNLFHATKNAA